MAEPVTTTAALTKAAYTAATVAAVGTGVSAYSAYQQGQSQKSWNEYNAAIARMKADSEQKAAFASAERLKMQNEQLRAKQRLAYGMSGVTMAGTPTDLLADTSEMQQLDIDTLLWNAESKSTFNLAGADLLTAQGEAAGRAGTISAGTSLLSGMTSIANTYATNQKDTSLLTALKGK